MLKVFQIPLTNYFSSWYYQGKEETLKYLLTFKNKQIKNVTKNQAIPSIDRLRPNIYLTKTMNRKKVYLYAWIFIHKSLPN